MNFQKEILLLGRQNSSTGVSKNNLIKKSDKKFIRREKARIRAQFLDFKKQEEMITELYKRFLGKSEIKEDKAKAEVKDVEVKKAAVKIKPKNKKDEPRTY